MFDAKYDRGYINKAVVDKIEYFWIFFLKNEENLVNALYKKDLSFINLFEKELNEVFSNYKKKVRFVFHKEQDVINFDIYYGRNSYILTIGNELFEAKKLKYKYKWAFNLLK